MSSISRGKAGTSFCSFDFIGTNSPVPNTDNRMGAGGMAEQVKVPAAKPEDFS